VDQSDQMAFSLIFGCLSLHNYTGINIYYFPAIEKVVSSLLCLYSAIKYSKACNNGDEL